MNDVDVPDRGPTATTSTAARSVAANAAPVDAPGRDPADAEPAGSRSTAVRRRSASHSASRRVQPTRTRASARSRRSAIISRHSLHCRPVRWSRKLDRWLRCNPGQEEGQRDGDETASVHSEVQSAGGHGGAARRPPDPGDRGQARSASEPGLRLEAPSAGGSAGGVRRRRQAPASRSGDGHPRPAREDRRVDRGARFLSRGLGS